MSGVVRVFEDLMDYRAYSGTRRYLINLSQCPPPPPPQPSAPPEDNNERPVLNLDEIVSDAVLKKQIHEFPTEIRDEVRRAYILKGPTQPIVNFPLRPFGNSKRAFSQSYESKDAAFCFYCFLFKEPVRAETFGYDVFNKIGFNDWKHAYKALPEHVGGVNSAHNSCVKHCDDFKNQRQSIPSKINRASNEAEELYRIRLTSSLECSRFLIAQGMAFRGHDESSKSLNKGNFLEMLDWYMDKNEIVRHAFDHGKNCKMTCPDIQKEFARCFTEEICDHRSIGDRKFSILIDESRDISLKEQMAVMLRKRRERFLALRHVSDTTSDTLKVALFGILGKYKLSISRIRGQGYDGASNMRGEFNGLQKKILDENPHAFCPFCCSAIHDFFEYVSLIVTTTSASCKRRDTLIESYRRSILHKLESLDIGSGRGKNQQTSLTRPGDTRWGSHHRTLIRLEEMWDSVIKVLEMVEKDIRGPSSAAGLLDKWNINIVHVMELIQDVKDQPATMRDSGCDEVFDRAKQYCEKQNISVPNMLDDMPVRGRSKRRNETTTFLHHYRAGIFFVALDKICVELNYRFGKPTIEILTCFSCIDPKNSFSRFDADKLVRTYILQVRRHTAFSTCTDLASLASKTIQTEKHMVFPLVYRLIKLALILPLSTTSVERAFSAMKIIQTKLRNKIDDNWFNDLLVCYIDKEIFKELDESTTLRRFQGIKNRRLNLPRAFI
ncbi:hypothetical protein BS78_01G507100 [Paspalum vaginatum]|nr:hypothetical protein BS78_01G507100 [Paspalum vaginatum]